MKPGHYSAKHANGEWHAAFVRKDFEGNPEIMIPACSIRWHALDHLRAQGWSEFKFVSDSKPD